jgi:hypothetical protein
LAPEKERAMSARLDILNVLNRSHSQQQPNPLTTQHVHKTSASKRESASLGKYFYMFKRFIEAMKIASFWVLISSIQILLAYIEYFFQYN